MLAGLALAAGGTPAAAANVFDVFAQAELLRLHQGRPEPARLDPDVDLLGVYFGAAWCGPCRLFVPELDEAYRELRQAPHRAEIVFVSDDSGAGAMADYMIRSRMPWLGLPYDVGRRSPQVQALRGLALPGLVVLDRQGQVRIDSWVRPGDSRPRDALQQLRDAARFQSRRSS